MRRIRSLLIFLFLFVASPPLTLGIALADRWVCGALGVASHGLLDAAAWVALTLWFMLPAALIGEHIFYVGEAVSPRGLAGWVLTIVFYAFAASGL